MRPLRLRFNNLQVLHSLEALSGHQGPTAVAIGNFDGVHIGHQALLSDLRKAAEQTQLKLTVLTFFPHPVEVLNPGKTLECLSTSAEKLVQLEAAGVELVLVAPFDRQLAQLSPDSFFQQYLVQGLQARRVHVGYNFCFGRNRAGDTESLRRLCEGAKVTLHVAPAYKLAGEVVSSSRIRQAVTRGSVEQAGRLLGRPYSIAGTVMAGAGRGRKLGVPTANLAYPPGKVLPQTGVYVTRTAWQGQLFHSVTNVGVKPTFEQAGCPVVIESHLLDFSGQLYGETIEVSFLSRLREERKFSSVDELKVAIEGDIRSAERYFSKPGA
ncbi:MAG: bifunctional riboflavin kinase/FAD synthetase [Bdellovibrionales bacterium]|nr:bifunctional riboflavin kinase/FAD synthetase [Bdellovibrionales bacterium]